ncbi:MAG TPA: alpha/beta hydrolase [Ktedonobacteraceae bacterium]|nr:alpha/beta hydrolase [Ktedonobacteraceae bacterium]
MNLLAQTVRGVVEYKIVGQGPVVLILNGGHTNCDSGIGHAPFFREQGYQLLIPSRPGYGKTPSSSGKTTEEFADTLVSLLDVLHIDSVIVVGISAGGKTALQFAGRHPERASKLILENAITGLPYPTGLVRLMSYVVFNPVVERGVWAVFRALGRRSPQVALKSMMGSLTTLPVKQVLAAMSPSQQQEALIFLFSLQSGSGFLHDIRHTCGDLSRITAPTLIIESQFDGSKDPRHARYAAEHIPHAQLYITPAESHLMWFSDHDKAIQTTMQTFLHA